MSSSGLVRWARERRFHCIRPATAAKLVEHGAVLVDVRTAEEWRKCHIPDARHVTFDARGGMPADLPPDRPLVLVSCVGRRAKRAAAVLAEHRRDVWNITGGLRAWQRAGLPIERPGTVS